MYLSGYSFFSTIELLYHLLLADSDTLSNLLDLKLQQRQHLEVLLLQLLNHRSLIAFDHRWILLHFRSAVQLQSLQRLLEFA